MKGVSQIQIPERKKSLEDGVFGWEQDAEYPEIFGRADERHHRDSVPPTTPFGREKPSTPARFSDSNPFRKQTQNLSANLCAPRSREREPQQGIGSHASSYILHRESPDTYPTSLTPQRSPTFSLHLGYSHPIFQPLPQQSPSGAASSSIDLRTREQMEPLYAPTLWSTPSHLGLQPSSTAYMMGRNPIRGGPSEAQSSWPHSGSPVSFQFPQHTLSPGRGPIIIGNQGTIHLICNRDSGNATTTTVADSANNSSSRISGNTGAFPLF